MPTKQQVPEIIESIEKRLDLAAQGGIHLEVSGASLDDEWLYVVVTPAEPGVRASDHAELMSEIEKELREQGTENVLLVPTVAE